MGPKCIVVFCKNHRGQKKNFYRLTKRRYNSWMRAIGRNPEEKLAIGHNAVCSDHFPADSFITIGNKRVLKATALPTMNLRPPRPSFQTLLSSRHSSLQIHKDVVSTAEQPSTSFRSTEVSKGPVNTIRPLLLVTKNSVIPEKHSMSYNLIKVSPGILRSITSPSQLPSSQAVTEFSYSGKNLVDSFSRPVEDEKFNPTTSVGENHDRSMITNSLTSTGTSRRYSVRMCHKYYVCSRKQKNKLDMIRKESKNMQKELKMATSSIKMLASDVKRLTERIDDLTDIVKLYVKKEDEP